MTRPVKSKGSDSRDTARPKIQDVAKAAKVSIGTVSAVLNGNGRVADATRQHVQRTMERLGYQPDLYASNLPRRQSRLLGIVVSNLQNPFFAETAQAIEEEAALSGYQISLIATRFSPERQRIAVRELLRARTTGIAVLTSEYDSETYEEVLASQVPTVFLDNGKPAKTITRVRVDAQSGIRLAVEHLIDLGHRDLLFLRNSQQTSGASLLSHSLRERGFLAAVRKHRLRGLRTRVCDLKSPGTQPSQEAFEGALNSMDFTAIVASTDVVAMMACHFLQTRGLQIPRDVSVIGFDNIEFSQYLNPPLSTVDIPRIELARAVVSALTGKTDQNDILIKTQIILRQSTAKPGERNSVLRS